MGDIENFLHITTITIIVSTLFLLKTGVCQAVLKCIQEFAMISDDYHDIERLLLLMIIVNSKNWTISIIVKENITVNRQLIPHPHKT